MSNTTEAIDTFDAEPDIADDIQAPEDTADIADDIQAAPAQAEDAVDIDGKAPEGQAEGQGEAKSKEAIGEGAQDEKASPEASAGLKKPYTLKIKGKEEVLELTDTELVDRLQKSEYADRRFNEAGLVEKRAKALFDLISKDPYEALRVIGHDPEKLAQDLVYAKARRALMTPEEQKISTLTAEVEQLRASHEQAAEKTRLEEVNAHETTISTEINAALKKAGIPLARDIQRTVVEFMLDAQREGVVATAEEVLPYAMADYKARVAESLGLMADEKLREYGLSKAASTASTASTASPGTKTGSKEFKKVVPKAGVAKPVQAPRGNYSPEDFVKSL